MSSSRSCVRPWTTSSTLLGCRRCTDGASSRRTRISRRRHSPSHERRWRFATAATSRRLRTARAAATLDSDTAFRALSIAGRAAHLASREDEALELYRRAEAAAATESEQRDARWGQLCAVELSKSPRPTTGGAALAAGVRRSDVKGVVRSAATGLSYQMNMGIMDLAMRSAAELLDGVGDPMLSSAFQRLFGRARLHSTIRRGVRGFDRWRCRASADYRLVLTLVHRRARTPAGLRRWTHADEHLTEAIRIAVRVAMPTPSKLESPFGCGSSHSRPAFRRPWPSRFLFGHHFRRPEQKWFFRVRWYSRLRAARQSALVDEVCGLSRGRAGCPRSCGRGDLCEAHSPVQSNGWWSSSTLPSEPVPSTFW